jgi:glutamate--cysteine ligase
VWTDVDPSRCGFLPSMFDNSFSYAAYVDWALDAPLLFLRRRGQYLRPQITFRQLLQDGFDGQPATHSDWVDHISTLFPEVRIKKVVEIRSADSADGPMTGALAALWRGLLYDPTALSDAARILPPLSYHQHLELMEVARRDGLKGTWEHISLARAAQDMVAVARRGLQALDPEDVPLLEPLEALAASGHSLAERVLRAFEEDKNPARLLARFSL